MPQNQHHSYPQLMTITPLAKFARFSFLKLKLVWSPGPWFKSGILTRSDGPAHLLRDTLSGSPRGDDDPAADGISTAADANWALGQQSKSDNTSYQKEESAGCNSLSPALRFRKRSRQLLLTANRRTASNAHLNTLTDPKDRKRRAVGRMMQGQATTNPRRAQHHAYRQRCSKQQAASEVSRFLHC